MAGICGLPRREGGGGGTDELELSGWDSLRPQIARNRIFYVRGFFFFSVVVVVVVALLLFFSRKNMTAICYLYLFRSCKSLCYTRNT